MDLTDDNRMSWRVGTRSYRLSQKLKCTLYPYKLWENSSWWMPSGDFDWPIVNTYFLYGAFPRVLRNWLEHIFVFLLPTLTPFAYQVPLHTVGTQYMFTEWKFSFLEHDEAPPLNGFRGLHFPGTPRVRSDCPDEKVRAELLKRLILPLESGECMGRCETYGHHYRVMSLSMCVYVGIIPLFLDCGSSQHGTLLTRSQHSEFFLLWQFSSQDSPPSTTHPSDYSCPQMSKKWVGHR